MQGFIYLAKPTTDTAAVWMTCSLFLSCLGGPQFFNKIKMNLSGWQPSACSFSDNMRLQAKLPYTPGALRHPVVKKLQRKFLLLRRRGVLCEVLRFKSWQDSFLHRKESLFSIKINIQIHKYTVKSMYMYL